MDTDILEKWERKPYLLQRMDTDILEKWERKPYLLHMMDTDILLKVKRDISSPHNGYRYFSKVCYLWYLSNHKVVYRCDFHPPV